MAIEQIKLSPLQQWAQNLPKGYDGVRVLADFWATDFKNYDAETKQWVLEAIFSPINHFDRMEHLGEPTTDDRFIFHRTICDYEGWECGLRAMIDNLNDDEWEAYKEARIFAEKYYNGDEQKLHSAEQTMMMEFFSQVFGPKE